VVGGGGGGVEGGGHSVQNLLSSGLLSKNVQMKTY